MADSGKQSPLGVNTLGSLLNNTGFKINPIAEAYIGISKDNMTYTPGALVNNTVLKDLTTAINTKFSSGISNVTLYNNLISIGSNTIPALGNSKPPKYQILDANVWPGIATTSYAMTGNVGQGQNATWLPYTGDVSVNNNYSITRYGFLRLFALQAYNEFNYNGLLKEQFVINGAISGTTLTVSSIVSGTVVVNSYLDNTTVVPGTMIVRQISGSAGGTGTYQVNTTQTISFSVRITGYTIDTTSDVQYTDFLGSFQQADSFLNGINPTIYTLENAKSFQQGTFSNMNDLITGDVSGVSLAFKDFGADLIALGRAIDLSKISTFGLPSTLLQTLYTNNCFTDDLSVALLGSDLEFNEARDLMTGDNTTPSVEQEKKIYSAFLLITGESLNQILVPLNCKTQGLVTLADLLDIKKLFPTSYLTLTVPIYNSNPNPTNSKTYYPIYVNDGVNSSLTNPTVSQIIGPQPLPGPPPITDSAATNTPTNVITTEQSGDVFTNPNYFVDRNDMTGE